MNRTEYYEHIVLIPDKNVLLKKIKKMSFSNLEKTESAAFKIWDQFYEYTHLPKRQDWMDPYQYTVENNHKNYYKSSVFFYKKILREIKKRVYDVSKNSMRKLASRKQIPSDISRIIGNKMMQKTCEKIKKRLNGTFFTKNKIDYNLTNQKADYRSLIKPFCKIGT